MRFDEEKGGYNLKIRITTKRGAEYDIGNLETKNFKEFMNLMGNANGGFISFNDISIHTTAIESVKVIQ